MGHYYRFAVKRSSKLLGEPVPGDVIPGNQVVQSQSSVVRVCPDVLEVVHALPGSVAGRQQIPCDAVVSPRSSTQDPDITQYECFIL